ncbi:MAG TPA: S1C family serine protease [Miltoncostaeaceae bacterium]|nr:S1C family serine protease [Miltoncostaeaceae bacterium]
MPTPSTIERIKLRRSVNRAFLLAGAAVIAALVVLVLALGGVFSRGSDSVDIPEIVARAKASTVMVISKVDDEPQGSGTGWVYDAGRGLIVTNAHVVNGGQTYSVRLESGERPVDVVGVAVCDDLALLRVADTGASLPPQLADGQDRVKQGQRVIALGFPASASEAGNLTATEGIVSVVRTRFDLASIDVPRYPNVIQTDAVINPGNSGGPLVDTDGRLVGVNSAGITLLGGRTIQGQGYAVGVDRGKEVIPTLATGVSAGWSGLGFDYIPDPEEVSGDLNDAGLPIEPGLLVTSAVEGSPAAQVGFGRGPVLITAVNGRQMDGSLPAFCEALGDPGTASEATYTVYESGDTAPKDVTVAVAGR